MELWGAVSARTTIVESALTAEGQAPSDGAHHETSDGIFYGCMVGLDGSISAEHGIGIDKRPWLGLSRSADELKLMRELKRLLDPQNLLNPGKVIN